MKMLPTIGGPLGSPAWLRTMWRLRHNPLGFFAEAQAALGEIYALNLGVKQIVALNHPRHARHVLADNATNYEKGGSLQTPLRRVVGNGLVTATGTEWRRQRRTLQPYFHDANLAKVADGMAQTIEIELAQWGAQAGPFELTAALTRLTMHVTARALFGVAASPTMLADLGQAMTAAYAQAAAGVAASVAPAWLLWPWHWRHRRNLQRLDAQIFNLIHRRLEYPNADGDLLSLLLSEQIRSAAPDAPAHDRQMRDEIVTMFISAHETVASCLTWTLWLLMQHAEAAERAHAEVAAALGERPPTPADLEALPFLKMVLHESLRLHPPGWRISRVAQAADIIDGYSIPAGASLLLILSVLHRRPDFWPDPQRFDPERFADGTPGGAYRYVWLPFGSGRRHCIGANFAILEMQLALARILQLGRLQLDVARSWRSGGPLRTATTLQPAGPLWAYYRTDVRNSSALRG